MSLAKLLLLPGLARRLVVPALLVVEPMLDAARARGDAFARAGRPRRSPLRLARLRPRACVDEDVVFVERDGKTALLERAGELGRLARECQSEPVEQPNRLGGLVEVDANAPVVTGCVGPYSRGHGLAGGCIARVRRRYRDGEARLGDAADADARQRQLTRMGNAAGAAGLAHLMAYRPESAEWFASAAACLPGGAGTRADR